MSIFSTCQDTFRKGILFHQYRYRICRPFWLFQGPEMKPFWRFQAPELNSFFFIRTSKIFGLRPNLLLGPAGGYHLAFGQMGPRQAIFIRYQNFWALSTLKFQTLCLALLNSLVLARHTTLQIKTNLVQVFLVKVMGKNPQVVDFCFNVQFILSLKSF